MGGSVPVSPGLRSPGYRDAVARVRAWTQARFGLGADAMILVTERAGTIPGGPPVETVVAFWEASPDSAAQERAGEGRYHFRVFKPVAEIAAEDLPYAWLKPALAAVPDFQCGCC